MDIRFEPEENGTEEEKSARQEVTAEGNGIPNEEETVPAGEVDERISTYVKEHIRSNGRQRKISAFRVLFFVVLIVIVVFFFVDYVLMKRQIVSGWFAQSSTADEDERREEIVEDGERENASTEDDSTEPTAGLTGDEADDPDGESGEETQEAGTGEAQGSAGADENNDVEKTDPGENNAGKETNSDGNQSETGSGESETTADPVETVMQYLVYIDTDADPSASVQTESMGGVHETAGVIVEIGQSAIRILTDYASVEQAETIEITLNGGETVSAQIETVNLNTGLALLVVSVAELSNETLKEIRMATWGDTADISVGTGLLLAAAANVTNSAGNSMPSGDETLTGTFMETGEGSGTQISLSEITILAVGEKKQPDAVFTTYSFYADVKGCHILVDENGDIVAISTEVADSTAGDTQTPDGTVTVVAYCADDLRGYIEKMVDGEEIPYVGITGVAVTDEIKESVSLDMPYGVYVWLADTGSPAYQAGILNGDIITAINGVKITTLREMRDAILGLKPGEEASFTLMRQGGSTYREYTIEVTPEAAEVEPAHVTAN